MYNVHQTASSSDCMQDTLSSRALGLAAECAREQRYLAYNLLDNVPTFDKPIQAHKLPSQQKNGAFHAASKKES